ncbi:MAG: 50S ribosomal protein L28 [Patescibacteria group bacterium]|jgi:large subunit ribosomal protein L28
MAQCFICKKGNTRGYQISHSNIKTKRLFKANLHNLSVRIDTNTLERVAMCSRCYKKIKGDFWAGRAVSAVPVSLLNQEKFKKAPVKTA